MMTTLYQADHGPYLYEMYDPPPNSAGAWSMPAAGITLARWIARNPYIWPGGYEVAAVMDDGAALCHQCTTDNLDEIAASTGTDGWHVIGWISSDWMDDPEDCAHCYRQIPKENDDDDR